MVNEDFRAGFEARPLGRSGHAACAQYASRVSDAAQQNMDAVRRFLSAINRDDLVAMCAELDEQVKWRTPVIHGVTAAREFQGHAAVREVWAEAKATAGGDLRVVLQTIEGDDDGVFAEGVLRTPGGMTPISYVMQMRGGKIHSADTFVIPGEATMSWKRRTRAQ